MKFPFWLPIVLLAASSASGAPAKPQDGTIQFSETEKWIVDQINSGSAAVVGVFPLEKRKIGGHFLEELLSGELSAVKPHRYGIRISDAIIGEPLDLSNAQVSCDVWLQNCQFNSPVKFLHAVFARVLSFNDSTFKGDADFVGTKIGQSAFFNNATFEDTVTFAIAETGNLEAKAAKFKKRVKFNGIKVRGAGNFDQAVFEGPVDFGLADFTWLNLSTPFWPKSPVQVRMQGVSYKYISAVSGDEPASHEALLNLADRSMYTADVYANLEEFFLRQGYRADANRAFIAGKRRERAEHLHGLSWAGSLLLDWLVGYGRHPERAGYVCIGIIILGCLLFPGSKMKLRDPKEEEKPEDIRPQYNRLWYSLGLFLPVVDLKTSDLWKPTNEHVFLQYYLRIHILLGWIFVPIFLAAISGLIK